MTLTPLFAAPYQPLGFRSLTGFSQLVAERPDLLEDPDWFGRALNQGSDVDQAARLQVLSQGIFPSRLVTPAIQQQLFHYVFEGEHSRQTENAALLLLVSTQPRLENLSSQIAGVLKSKSREFRSPDALLLLAAELGVSSLEIEEAIHVISGQPEVQTPSLRAALAVYRMAQGYRTPEYLPTLGRGVQDLAPGWKTVVQVIQSQSFLSCQSAVSILLGSSIAQDRRGGQILIEKYFTWDQKMQVQSQLLAIARSTHHTVLSRLSAIEAMGFVPHYSVMEYLTELSLDASSFGHRSAKEALMQLKGTYPVHCKWFLVQSGSRSTPPTK